MMTKLGPKNKEEKKRKCVSEAWVLLILTIA